MLSNSINIFFFFLLVCSLSYSIQNGNQCNISYSITWSFPYGSAPFFSYPLVCHLDRDSSYDIVSLTSSGEVFGINGQSGEVLNNWPLYLNGSEFLSSPLLFDFNRDGLDDIVLVSESGNIQYASIKGEFLDGESYQIPTLAFSRYWYKTNLVDQDEYFDYYSNLYKTEQILSPHSNMKTEAIEIPNKSNKIIPIRNEKIGIDPDNASNIYLQPHIHTTPLIEYLTLVSEHPSLIIPVSFYLDSYLNQDLPGLTIDELNEYLVEAIIILDPLYKLVTDFKIISINKMDSKNPSIILSKPTVLNMLESSDRSLILASTNGNIYKLSLPDLKLFKDFPLRTGIPISDAPIIFDYNGDGSLEIFAINEEGDIFCFDRIGHMIWSLSLDAKIPLGGGIRMVNIQGPTLVTATSEGLLYALNPVTGKILQNYPISTEVSLTGAPILVHVSPKLDPIWVILSDQGDLVVYSDLSHCSNIIKGDHSFISTIPLLHHNIFDDTSRIELIVTSSGGYLSLLSLESNGYDEEQITNSFSSWESQMGCHVQNVQRNLSISVYLTSLSVINSIFSSYKLIFMNLYNVQYIVNDNSILKKYSDKYRVTGKVGQKILFSRSHLATGTYSENFDMPYVEMQTIFTLLIRNKNGFCDYFQFPVCINCHWKDFLKWLLVIPFIGMNVVIVFLLLEAEFFLPRYLPTK